jgi:CRP/FNR family transcriptional regulator, dissimilatory nitrate respiration regulator
MIEIMSNQFRRYLHGLRAHNVVLAPGRYLFHLGDKVRFMHYVVTGMIHLIRTQSDGSMLVLQQATAGSFVAEASFCSEHYHCDAVAVGETHALTYPVAEFCAQLRSDPDFADVWARHLAHELQIARMHAEILSLKTVAQRLDAWLGWRGGELPRKGEGRTVADEIGVSPEALYREIARRRGSSKSNNRHGVPAPA